MKLDKIILILHFYRSTRQVYVFTSQSEYKRFIESHLKEFESNGLTNWEIYYAKLAQKG